MKRRPHFETLPRIRGQRTRPDAFLPMTPEEARRRGWEQLDVVFVTGDAYVDHPSFANALLGRVLESAGWKVALLSQPDWRSCQPWRAFGRPRLFFAVSAGNMDSMLNHYTANRKVRNDDAYSPGGEVGRRPDRATLAYCQRAREAFPDVPVIAGGVEASLRRIAHYDYWSDRVRRSILLDSKADLLVYGMGERGILEIARRLHEGRSVRDLRSLRGVAYRLGAREALPARGPWAGDAACGAADGAPGAADGATDGTIELPSFEEVASDPIAFCRMTRLAHQETNPYNARRLVQRHGDERVVVNPPALPLTREELDRVYDLPYTRRPHPSYGRKKIPAWEVIRNSVQIMRGCFGGCTFCSITAHEGRIVQSRSERSVLAEIRAMAADPEFTGVVSDLGGPTANMYRMRCTRPEVEAKCRRLSCVHPTICTLLGTDHRPLVELMRRARSTPGVKKVLVASGVRMDLARRSPEYIRELASHHTGGYLKVAPEHTDPEVLARMKKPGPEDFTAFDREFRAASRRSGKEQYLIPYYIASHPGSDLRAMIDLAVFLKRNGYRPDQVQDFIPSPFDLATCMYHTGLDPMTITPVHVARRLGERRMQRALLQFFKPENWFEVRRALVAAGRADLIGAGCDCLIPAKPPMEALLARRARARRAMAEQVEGDHIRGGAPAPGRGSRRAARRRGTASAPARAAEEHGREAGGGYRAHRKTHGRHGARMVETAEARSPRGGHGPAVSKDPAGRSGKPPGGAATGPRKGFENGARRPDRRS